jgi:thioredoxin-related protein
MRSIPFALAFAFALALGPAPAAAQVASPHAIEIPKWFSESFLDLPEEVRDAAREGRRLMLYFGQDGCPYCKALMKVNFGDPAIEAFTRKHFVAVALNIWGDREVKWLDGRTRPEKELASFLKVQYTPTLLFFDEQAQVVLRLNGYQPPERFRVALDYARLPKEGRPAYADYVAGKQPGTQPAQPEEAQLTAARAAGKTVLVIVSKAGCKECDELEREGLRRPEIARLRQQFTVLRFDAAGPWARANGITYTPTLVFLDLRGTEVFRTEGYLRPFHLAATFDYVASGAYRGEPSFQRYLQARSDRLRAEGKSVDLWQ